MEDGKASFLPDASGEFQGPPVSYMKHGLLLDYELYLPESILSVICTETLRPTVHCSKGCRIYHKADLLQEFTLNCTFNQLLSTTNKLFVGVCRHCLKLLDNNFQCFYETDHRVNILRSLLFQHPETGEIITSGQGNITDNHSEGKVAILADSYTPCWLLLKDGLHNTDEVGHLHLKESPSQYQHLFAAVQNGIKVFSLESGKLLVDLADMHSQNITAIFVFQPLNYVITGAKDGTLKVWDSVWQPCCTFVGHSAQVTAIVPYPYGQMVVSASQDCTVKVWNLLSHDQVDSLEHETPVEGLFCKYGVPTVLCYTKNKLVGRRVNKLYTQAAVIGREISFLNVVKHPMFPLQVIASCTDSAVRMVSPTGGHITTTALLPLQSSILSLGYVAHSEMLYVLDTVGVLYLYDTKTNPSMLKTTSLPHARLGKLTCLCVYEAILDEEDKEEALANDKWLKVVLEAKKINQARKRVDVGTEQISTFLLGGTDSGHLLVLDLQTTEIIFSVKGKSENITMMFSNPKSQQIISASSDNLIQVWRLYPHVQELLSLNCSFTIASSPCLIATLAERLIFACNNTELAMYNIDLYSITQNVCFTGHPAYSHTDVITGLDSFPRLNIFASCGCDRTVRIWTEDNQLLQVLQIDGVPHGVVFCNFEGDLILELYCNLHVIKHTTYFTEHLMKQSLLLHVPEPIEHSSKVHTMDVSELKPEDYQRLQIVEPNIHQDRSGMLSSKELDELLKLEQQRSAGLQLISARNEELKMIMRGSIVSKKRAVASTASDKEKAWRELIRILHPELLKPKIFLPQVDNFNPDAYSIEEQTSNQSMPYKKGPQLQFFPPLATFSPPYPLAPDGYIPNSLILQDLRKSVADQMLAKEWKPIVLSQKQLNEIKENIQGTEEEASPEVSTGLKDKLQAALAAEYDSPKSLTPSPPPTPPPPSPPKRVIVPLKKVEKIVAPKKAKIATPPHTPTPPIPPHPPTPPPPPCLPDFIAQFEGKPWFEKLFPTPQSKESLFTMNVREFSNTLISCINKSTDTALKADICLGLSQLFAEKLPPDGNAVYNCIIAQLLGPPPITCGSLGEGRFIIQALKLIFLTNTLDAALTNLLLFYYAHGDSALQQMITNYLLRKGLNDPFSYFPTVIQHNLLVESSSQGSTELFATCKQWFQEWTRQLVSEKQQFAKPTNVKVRGTKKAATTQLKATPENTEKQAIEVLNFIIATEHEKELSIQKPPPPTPPPPPEPQEVLRNAIIALPKIHHPHSLVRLGETHKSCCHPERETTYSLICQLPHLAFQQGARGHSAHSLSLPITRQNINPFLTEEEKSQRSSEKGASLSSIVRYFVPGSSYVRDISL